jgi:hypothetical protein
LTEIFRQKMAQTGAGKIGCTTDFSMPCFVLRPVLSAQDGQADVLRRSFYIAQQQASALYFRSSKERCDKILLSCQAWNPHNCAHVTFFNQKGGRDERHCNFRTIEYNSGFSHCRYQSGRLGSQRNQIAETEMPGLMAIREEFAASQPLKARASPVRCT